MKRAHIIANACDQGLEPRQTKRDGSQDGSYNEAGEVMDLARKAMQGSETAEDKLLRKCRPLIRAQLQRLILQDSDIDDLTQETMLVLLNQIRAGNIREPAKIFAYAKSTARFQFLMGIRKNQRWLSFVERQPKNDNYESSSPQHASFSIEQALKNAWDNLSVPRDKALLLDIAISKCDRNELSEKYQVTSAHFDRIVHRARGRYKEALQAEFET